MRSRTSAKRWWGSILHASVMTFNIWFGGESGKQPLDQTAKVIQAAQSDLVGVQESCGHEQNGKRPDNARIIAEKLSWHYFSQGDDSTSIMSRYKIIAHTPKKWAPKSSCPQGAACGCSTPTSLMRRINRISS